MRKITITRVERDDNENKINFIFVSVYEVCATDSKITSVNLANIIMECAYFSAH